ncbi:MAG TPA: hypothetical protein VHK69_05895 [Chitinophagaceae bacterium]|jgi:hypothetical protein|nr:hypothetical protein [Chitinophagaceae bacterium]
MKQALQARLVRVRASDQSFTGRGEQSCPANAPFKHGKRSGNRYKKEGKAKGMSRVKTQKIPPAG